MSSILSFVCFEIIIIRLGPWDISPSGFWDIRLKIIQNYSAKIGTDEDTSGSVKEYSSSYGYLN